MSHVRPIPEGYHTVTPHLVTAVAARAIEFYKKAFGAEEIKCITDAGGRMMHGEIKIGDSIVMLCDEFPEFETFSPERLQSRDDSFVRQ